MSVYLVNFCRGISDKAAVEAYWKRVGESYSDKGKVLAAYTPFEVLEGDIPIWGIVVLEFPTMVEAKAWYFGPEYQEIKKLREGAQDNICALVEGGWVAAADRQPPANWQSRAMESPK